MGDKSYRTESLLGHTLGMVFAVTLFSVYTFGKTNFTANWSEITFTLFLFGVVYELLSWIFFNLFKYFTNTRMEQGEVVTINPKEPSKTEIKTK